VKPRRVKSAALTRAPAPRAARPVIVAPPIAATDAARDDIDPANPAHAEACDRLEACVFAGTLKVLRTRLPNGQGGPYVVMPGRQEPKLLHGSFGPYGPPAAVIRAPAPLAQPWAPAPDCRHRWKNCFSSSKWSCHQDEVHPRHGYDTRQWQCACGPCHNEADPTTRGRT